MNLRRARSVHARALARLGWSYEPIPVDAHKARECYAGAVELESGNLSRAATTGRKTGAYHLVGNVISGSERITPRLIPNVQPGKPLDERQCFNAMMRFARSYLGSRSAKLLGVHILFHDGFSHLALTYWRRGAWIRRYSIVLPEKHTGRDVEFAFTFSFFGPFRDFCLQAAEMDRVAGSLQFD